MKIKYSVAVACFRPGRAKDLWGGIHITGKRHDVALHVHSLSCLVLNLVVHKATTRLHVFC
jgi:hypothetical protein